MAAVFTKVFAAIMAVLTFIWSFFIPSTKCDLKLEFDSNPTTGYYWYCTVEDKTVVKLVSENYESSDPDGKLVGAGGTQSFCFAAVSQGETSVTFKYSFASGESEFDQTVTYTFTVDENMKITATKN